MLGEHKSDEAIAALQNGLAVPILILGMNVSNVQVTEAAMTANVEQKRVQLQALLFKKSLEMQQQQSDELRRMADGKGRVVDIRV